MSINAFSGSTYFSINRREHLLTPNPDNDTTAQVGVLPIVTTERGPKGSSDVHEEFNPRRSLVADTSQGMTIEVGSTNAATIKKIARTLTSPHPSLSETQFPYLTPVAKRHEESFSTWVARKKYIRGCEIIYEGAVRTFYAAHRSLLEVEFSVCRTGEIPIAIKCLKENGWVSITPRIDPAKIQVVQQSNCFLPEILEAPDQTITQVIYQNTVWDVVEGTHPTEFIIRKEEQNHQVAFDSQQYTISVDGTPIPLLDIQVASARLHSLESYLLSMEDETSLQLTYPDPSHPNWKAKIVVNTPGEVEIQVDAPGCSPFSLIFLPNKGKWVQVATYEELSQKMIVRHPVSS